MHENDLVLVLSLSLAFACLGFLPFNLRPGGGAHVFMGDAGSQVLGFMLAALGLASSWTTAGTTVATMLLPLLVLAIPILDTTLVTIRRLAERRPVTQGGKDHTSHRLVYYGLSETKAVALLALIAVALGATSVAYNVLDRPAVTALGVLLTFALLVQFGGFLAELSEQERRGSRATRACATRSRCSRAGSWSCSSTRSLVCGTFLVAYALFVEGRGTELQRGTFLAVLPVLLGTTYVAYVLFGIYRRAWRYATARDLATIALASALATLAAFGIVVAMRDLGDFPTGVFLLYGVVAAALAALSRWCVRLVPEAGGGDGRHEAPRSWSSALDAPAAGLARDARGGGRRPRRRASSTTARGFAGGECRACRSSARRATPPRRSRRREPTRSSSRSPTHRPSARARDTCLRGGRRPASGRARAPAGPRPDTRDRRVSAEVNGRVAAGDIGPRRARARACCRSSAPTCSSRRSTPGRRGGARRRRSSATSSS